MKSRVYSIDMQAGRKFYTVDSPLALETIKRIDRAKSYAEIKAIVLSAVRSSLIQPDKVTDMRGKTLDQIAAEIAQQQMAHNTRGGDIVAVVFAATDKWADICQKILARINKATSRRAAIKILRDFVIDRIGLPSIGDVLLAHVFGTPAISDSLAELCARKGKEKMQRLLMAERKRTKPVRVLV